MKQIIQAIGFAVIGTITKYNEKVRELTQELQRKVSDVTLRKEMIKDSRRETHTDTDKNIVDEKKN